MAVDNKKLAISGAVAGVVTPYLLSWLVVPILNFFGNLIPAFSLKLAEEGIALNIRASLTGLQGGLAEWLTNAFGVTVASSPMNMLFMSAAGGALLFVAGGFVADMLGILKGNAVAKTRAVIFTGSVLAAFILGTIGLPPEIGLSLVNVLLAMLVNAYILAWLYGAIDEKAKLGLVPF